MSDSFVPLDSVQPMSAADMWEWLNDMLVQAKANLVVEYDYLDDDAGLTTLDPTRLMMVEWDDDDDDEDDGDWWSAR